MVPFELVAYHTKHQHQQKFKKHSSSESEQQAGGIVPSAEDDVAQMDPVTGSHGNNPMPGISNVADGTTVPPPNAIETWDLVGKLLNKETKKMMEKQSSMISNTYRQRSSSELGENSKIDGSFPLKKRRKWNENNGNEATVITDDDSSRVSGDTNINNNNAAGLPAFISGHVNRMARMSKYVMEIEYCHRMLREEMKAMENHQQP